MGTHPDCRRGCLSRPPTANSRGSTGDTFWPTARHARPYTLPLWWRGELRTAVTSMALRRLVTGYVFACEHERAPWVCLCATRLR